MTLPVRMTSAPFDNSLSSVAICWEKVFKERLEKQRDESAKRQLEQQKIETAKSTQLRIVAEGERDKAQERVNQEKEQVKKLIAIETRLKEEKTNKEWLSSMSKSMEFEMMITKFRFISEN